MLYCNGNMLYVRIIIYKLDISIWICIYGLCNVLMRWIKDFILINYGYFW